MGLFSKIKNKFSKIALSFSLLLGAVAGVAGLANVGWAKGVSGWSIPNGLSTSGLNIPAPPSSIQLPFSSR